VRRPALLAVRVVAAAAGDQSFLSISVAGRTTQRHASVGATTAAAAACRPAGTDTSNEAWAVACIVCTWPILALTCPARSVIVTSIHANDVSFIRHQQQQPNQRATGH